MESKVPILFLRKRQHSGQTAALQQKRQNLATEEEHSGGSRLENLTNHAEKV